MMKKMTLKKAAAVLIGVAMTVSLAACGSRDSGNQDSESGSGENASEVRQEEENRTAESAAKDSAKPDETLAEVSEEEKEAESKTENGKTLVVYYSATGHTEGVAGYIAAATNADMFELEPVEPYSQDDLNWTDENSRVVYEHDNPEARQVELVAANDFTGKTVIPFCTSSSSGLGESGELLAQTAGTGNWLEGERFSSGASEEEVREWVESLEY